MNMPDILRDFLVDIISEKSRKELTEWLESNSATVIVDELRKYIETK